MKIFDQAKETVGRVFTTSSKTKLLLTIGGITYVEAQPVPAETKAVLVSGLIAVFVLAQGFAEGLSRKYGRT